MSKHPENKCNLAFKINYCNGREDALDVKHVGFRGVCTPGVIEENITSLKRDWCSQPECSCRQFLDGKIKYPELQSRWDQDPICMESYLLIDWVAYAGSDRKNGRTARKILYGEPGKLAVLTTQFPSDPKNRKVFAVFIIDEIFSGDDDNCGWVGAHPDYRLELLSDEAIKINFNDYYKNEWYSSLFRYMYDDSCAELLYKIMQIKKGTPDFELAKEMYHYYCQHNGIKEKK